MNNSHKTVIAIFSIIFILAGCAQQSYEESRRIDGLTIRQRLGSDKQSIAIDKVDMKMTLPGKWEVKTPSDMDLGTNKLFAAFGPSAKGYASNMQVAAVEVPGADLNVFITDFEANTVAEPNMKDFKTLNDKKIDTGGARAVRKSYAATFEEEGKSMPLVFDAVFIKRGKTIIVVEMITSAKSYKSLAPVFDGTVKSINFG